MRGIQKSLGYEKNSEFQAQVSAHLLGALLSRFLPTLFLSKGSFQKPTTSDSKPQQFAAREMASLRKEAPSSNPEIFNVYAPNLIASGL